MIIQFSKTPPEHLQILDFVEASLVLTMTSSFMHKYVDQGSASWSVKCYIAVF